MNIALDHVVLAAPDLEQAKADFQSATGVQPVDGGPHPGGGTRNALVSFGVDSYLEIIAPDPAQPLAGTNGERFAALPSDQLLHWAVRCDDLPAVSAAAIAAGLKPGPIRDMARNTPAGERLEWQLMGIGGYTPGGCMPFFIDWQQTPHPAVSAPQVGALKALRVGADSALRELLADVPGVTFTPEGSGLEISFDSPVGTRSLRADAPAGFGF